MEQDAPSGAHKGAPDWQKVAAQRDAPAIERVIEEGERRGQDMSGWRLLLWKVKRDGHLPVHEE